MNVSKLVFLCGNRMCRSVVIDEGQVWVMQNANSACSLAESSQWRIKKIYAQDCLRCPSEIFQWQRHCTRTRCPRTHMRAAPLLRSRRLSPSFVTALEKGFWNGVCVYLFPKWRCFSFVLFSLQITVYFVLFPCLSCKGSDLVWAEREKNEEKNGEKKWKGSRPNV